MTERVSLITGNEGKAREYAALLGVEVTAVKEDLAEIQSLDVVEVIERKAADAYAKLRSPVLVDDTGLVLNAWDGLPGALADCLRDRSRTYVVRGWRITDEQAFADLGEVPSGEVDIEIPAELVRFFAQAMTDDPRYVADWSDVDEERS